MPKHAVGVIVVKDNKVLLVKNTDKSAYAKEIYGAPAGRPEEDETEKQAAVREFKEETGLETTEEQLFEFANNYYTAVLDRKEGQVEYSIRFFRVGEYSGDLKPSEETIPEWIDLDRINEMTLVPNVKEAIEAALRIIHLEVEGTKPQ